MRHRRKKTDPVTISCYDLKDNLIMIFESEEDCAEHFGVTINCLRSYLYRVKKGELDKKKNKYDKKWYRLFRIDEVEYES